LCVFYVCQCYRNVGSYVKRRCLVTNVVDFNILATSSDYSQLELK
jgi:hypothetical protein